MALAFVAVMSMSLGALMTVISIPNKTFTTNSSSLVKHVCRRVATENIADNELVFQSLNLIQPANASSALAEWNDYCSSLTTAELRDVMNEAGLADVYAINPSEVSAAVVSGFVRRMFYSVDNNSAMMTAMLVDHRTASVQIIVHPASGALFGRTPTRLRPAASVFSSDAQRQQFTSDASCEIPAP